MSERSAFALPEAQLEIMRQVASEETSRQASLHTLTLRGRLTLLVDCERIQNTRTANGMPLGPSLLPLQSTTGILDLARGG